MEDTEQSEPPVAQSTHLQTGEKAEHAVSEAQNTSSAPIPETVPPEHLPIYNLESALLRFPQVKMPVTHEFCNGIYARTMHIPKDTMLTGAVHRDECFFLVREGELIVTTEDGAAVVGPGFMSVTRAGTKRAGVALTDVVVTTFHANPDSERDPEKLWERYVVPAPRAALEAVNHPLLQALEEG